MMELTKSQKVAYDAMKSGKNVFITGGAGTGKTKLIQEFISEVDPYVRNTILMAPTGKAAINMKIKTPDGHIEKGKTVHRTLGIKQKSDLFNDPSIPKIFHSAKRIIIDEISMMGCDLFDYFSKAFESENCRRYQEVDWESSTPMVDPIQLIVVGDFYQLPPVNQTYALQSEYWSRFKIKTFELTEICRQKDNPEFAEALNRLRVGDKECIHYFNENCLLGKKHFDPFLITLCGKNPTVKAINDQHIPSDNSVFYADILNNYTNEKPDWSSVPCEETLTLFPDALVMCVANNKSAMNGEIGVVKEIHNNYITVQWKNGNKNDVERYTWSVEKQIETKECVGFDKDNQPIYIKFLLTVTLYEITQFPLVLAYAFTTHKAQGETIKAGGNILLGGNTKYTNEFFAPGQLYTALSRFTDPRNICLSRPLIEHDISVDKFIYNFFNK